MNQAARNSSRNLFPWAPSWAQCVCVGGGGGSGTGRWRVVGDQLGVIFLISESGCGVSFRSGVLSLVASISYCANRRFHQVCPNGLVT